MNNNLILEKYMKYLFEFSIFGPDIKKFIKDSDDVVNFHLKSGKEQCDKKFSSDDKSLRKCYCNMGIKAYEIYIKELRNKVPLCKGNKKCLQTLGLNIQVAHNMINKAKKELMELK